MEEKNYDIHSEEELKSHAAESEKIADQFLEACQNYAETKISLSKRYLIALNQGKIKESAALDKAYIAVTDDDVEAQAEYELYIKSEMLMKGLEKVLEARSQSRMIHQSLLKNRIAQGV